MDNNILFSVFIFLASACIAVSVASRFKLSSVLGYLAAGILIGPFGLGLIKNAVQIMHFAEFGVIMMLFLIGLELEPEKLYRLRKTIIGAGSIQVGATSLTLMLLGIAIGFDWRVSLACSMALSLSSTAIALQILQERSLLPTILGQSSFAVLLFQDIAVIPILLILPLLGTITTAEPVSDLFGNLPVWAHTLLVMGIIAVTLLAAKFLSRYLFNFVAKSNLREIFTATSLSLVIGITLLMKLVGVSPALGSFIAGVVLANSEYKRTIESDIEPFKEILLGLFFISIGINMNFALFSDHALGILATVMVLITIKSSILYLLARRIGLGSLQKIGFALLLSQGSEFAFILFQYANKLKILDNEQAGFLALTVGLSMAATPVLLILFNRFVVPYYMSIRPDTEFDRKGEGDYPVIIAGYGRSGQIVGRFLTAQHVPIIIFENDPDQIELIRRFGNKVYFGDASRLDLLKSAGADKAKLLILCIDDTDKAIEITRMVKSEFPNLKIIARARNRRHAYELNKAGVDYFRRETFDSSLMLARAAMTLLGHPADEVDIKATEFMHHDEKTLKQSFEFFDHEPELISFYKTANQELERILQNDLKGDINVT